VIQTREAKVAWLYARSRARLTNFALAEWLLVCDSGEASSLWEDWEAWFRSLHETHALTPVLAFVPTMHRGQTWLAAAAVALDSASFCLAALDMHGLPAAAVCHRTGVDALRLITAQLTNRQTADLASLAAPHFDRADFDAACDRMETLGARVKPGRQDCWNQFIQLRSEYEQLLPQLASRLLVPMQDAPLRSFAIAAARTAGSVADRKH
jgi:hypothetical protein